jgi:CRISPR-associated endonuclease/helicase Cas3
MLLFFMNRPLPNLHPKPSTNLSPTSFKGSTLVKKHDTLLETMTFYAHSLAGKAQVDWEPLFTGQGSGHLEKVALLCAQFSSEMFASSSKESEAARNWGYIAGLWHDLGKFSIDFQNRLNGSPARVDHSTAGALFAAQHQPYGPLLSYLIAGHHAGLPNGHELFNDRFKGILPAWEDTARQFLTLDLTSPLILHFGRQLSVAELAFTLRMLFSCLVDADYLATEAFMQPSESSRRPHYPSDILAQMHQCLDNYYGNHFPSPHTHVETIRSEVRKTCLEKAALPPGFFSLTVPTGGGKTLASLSFALHHALKQNNHGFRRIIYTIPYTSIIEQNADIFRRVFDPLSLSIGQEIVLEHHSNFEAKETENDHQKPVWRMASENWDAPLIATTNVQFFESLYAHRTSRCRKLHHIARSIIILDEAQAIPVNLIKPILNALNCLIKDFGCTVVFCTATQPALQQRDDFPIGIPASEITEIAPEPAALQSHLQRVHVETLGQKSHEDLLHHVQQHGAEGTLVIFNTTKAAANFYHLLDSRLPKFHLSARMCPVHRRAVLSTVSDLCRSKQPCILVSTQVVEAGVDISFPIVYRAECGIDSLAQAAGRCNRHGEWGLGPNARGRVYFFQDLVHPLSGHLMELKRAADISLSHILGKFNDLLSLDAIEAYFRQSIWLCGGNAGQDWDKYDVLGCFPHGNSAKAMNFAEAAEKFQMIPHATHPVLISWDSQAQDLIQELKQRDKQGRPPSSQLYRQAQKYSVHVYSQEWPDILNKSESLHDGAFVILSQTDQNYDPATGLKSAQNKPFLYS